MSTKVKFYVLVIILVIMLGWGGNLIPSRVEITDLGIIQVLGIDSGVNNGVNLSVVAEGAKGDSEESSQKGNETIVTTSGKSFNDCARGMENYSDKYFIGGHIENIVIGEDISRQNLVRAVDFVSKSSEIRLNANMFIVKGSSATDFLKDSTSKEFSLASRISNINLTDEILTEEKNTEVSDVVNILLSDEKCGVIQAIELVENGAESGREFTLTSSNEDNKKFMQYAGYGLIKDAKLAGFLDIDASDGYDIVKNRTPKKNIYVEKAGEIVGINFNANKTKVKFKFEGDNLKEIIIKAKTENEVMQSSNGENVFESELPEMRRLVEQEVIYRIEKAIDVARNYRVDYMGIGKMLEMKHPYKWNKIKDNWENIFYEVSIKVEAKAKIDRSYNLLSVVN